MKHAERGRRFAYISSGDITRWAKGASRFVYPEPKNRKQMAKTVGGDLVACASCASVRPSPQAKVVMIAGIQVKPSIQAPNPTDAMDVVESSNRMANILSTLGKAP